MTIKAEQLADAFTRRYKIYRPNRQDREVRTIGSTLPYDAVEREARKVGLTVEEFIDKYEAEYWYGNFDGMYIKFVKSDEKQAVKE